MPDLFVLFNSAIILEDVEAKKGDSKVDIRIIGILGSNGFEIGVETLHRLKEAKMTLQLVEVCQTFYDVLRCLIGICLHRCFPGCEILNFSS